MYIVGSHALNHVLCIRIRDPMDVDVIGTYEEVNNFLDDCDLVARYPLNADKVYARTRSGTIIEGEYAWEGSTAEEFLELAWESQEFLRMKEFSTKMFLVPTMNLLYALKMSHRYLKNSPHFKKTMADIHLLRSHGATIEDRHLEWFQRREKATYNYEHPKLNQKKSEFFNSDTVAYVYDHDSIHQVMKHDDRPAYDYFKPNANEVFTSRKLFEQLPDRIRLNAVLEETYVLALERSQIPFPNTPPKVSFEIALEKVCTSITSGWFREYAYENYPIVMHLYDDNYVQRFQRGVESGIVKPFSERE